VPATIALYYCCYLTVNHIQVERRHRELNPHMVQYFETFKALEGMGILDPRSDIDIFYLHQIFVPIIRETMDRFYLSLQMQKKRKSTKNPNYPPGALPIDANIRL
jgi:hypothetical protein